MKIRLGLFVLRVFSALPNFAVRGIARLAAWIVWRARGRLRRLTEGNIELAFPSLSVQRRKQLAQDSVFALCVGIIELGKTWFWPVGRLLGQVVGVEGARHLQNCRAEGGLVVLVPHLGNFELVAYFLAQRFAITAMYKPSKNDALNDIVKCARERCGIRLVPANVTGARACLKAVRSGEVVLLLPDQNPKPGYGIFAPFFGEPTYTMTLPTKLLHRSGARAIGAYCKRTPASKYEVVFVPVSDAIYDENILTSATALNQLIERCVLDCVEQYTWQYKRYKYLPDLELRKHSGRGGR